MSFQATVPYADLNYANTYFDERLQTTIWDKATDLARNKALKSATRFINQLNLIGTKTTQDQVNEFPRLGDDTVPDEVCQACCELALSFLSGNPLSELGDQAGVTSTSVGDASTSFGPRGKQTVLDQNLGCPSPEAARLLSP